ncbi:MAG: N-acetylneuraminate synthase family protein [Acidobacteriaceae bacterium]|nr:N-acetylneuraminate synthase family protein [Acidobacteriaceae bacterium]
MSFELSFDRSLIVAEVAQAHDGSLGTAHAYIDAVARAGADAIKFQTHIAAAESSPAEPWRVRFSYQDLTRYEYWRRMEFTPEQWAGLKGHAEQKGLLFLSSPFSIEAAQLLERLGMVAWKIASGEVGNWPLFEFLLATRRPVLLSTGMSPLEEVDRAVRLVQDSGVPVAVLQCTSQYPCPAENIGLNLIPFFRRRYGCFAGLSDHSGAIYPGLAAAAIGMSVLEIHITLSRESFGPDVPASITIDELNQLVEGVRFIERMRAHPVDKSDQAREMEGMRRLFTRSVAAVTDLSAGTILKAEHLGARKPGTGIPIEELPALVGRRLRREVRAGTLLRQEDLEPDEGQCAA